MSAPVLREDHSEAELQTAALLILLANDDGMSLHKACKKLGMAMSEMRRLLSSLGGEGGLLALCEQGARQCLYLTAPGRALAASLSPAQTRRALLGSTAVMATHISAQGLVARAEVVAEEVAVALCYNGLSHAVMMCSPCDLEDFALGFSLSEGIIESAADVLDIEIGPAPEGISIELRIVERRMHALKERRRSLVGRTGCGLCGAESLTQAIVPVRRVSGQAQFSPAMIHAGFAQLAAEQSLFQATGAVHAAGFVHAGGVLVREDIGRHNALDKVIGAMQGKSLSEGFALITSRASYEMLHKTASANIPLLAAISAPSSRAIALAQEAGVTLLGFTRELGMTCYVQGRAQLIE